jgi:hypothetical protein
METTHALVDPTKCVNLTLLLKFLKITKIRVFFSFWWPQSLSAYFTECVCCGNRIRGGKMHVLLMGHFITLLCTHYHHQY